VPVRLQHSGPLNYALLYCRGIRSDLYLFKELMKRIHLKQAAVSLVTVFTLFVSAISACACSHHQPQTKAEQPSCHPATHGNAAVEAAGPSHSESLTPGCNCLVRTPVPAITAKTEKKKAAADKVVYAAVALARPGPPIAVLTVVHLGFDSSELVFPGWPLTSLPSRAPPRL
jgi:hypothetical protein